MMTLHSRALTRFAFAGIIFISAGALTAQTASSPQPKVLVIATGGTIAGVQDAPGTTAQYHAGTLTAEQIVASVPQVAEYAQVETQQFSNVPSGLITPAQSVALARRIH